MGEEDKRKETKKKWISGVAAEDTSKSGKKMTLNARNW
jgi:hypothetical protein